MDSQPLVNALDGFGLAARQRHQAADHLQAMAQLIQQAETTGTKTSGQLGFERQIMALQGVSETLRQGVFRLVVLGDLKRGKSTLLNALLGERLLPSDVNPCTALITVLKYGPQKQATIHYLDDTPAQQIDLDTFRQTYTIDPEESKTLAQQQTSAFPRVSHAVIEYPLPLLAEGVELIDTPGLNDTEVRNQQVLTFLNDCQGVLFVLSPSQPCTLDERRYLQNYLKDRGLALFFLINAWDKLRESLVDPEDAAALAAAETSLRQVFRTHLAAYCQVGGQDYYRQRVFEMAALPALRSQLQSPPGSLAGTGIPELLAALQQFLTQDRIRIELNYALQKGRQVYHQVYEAVARRLPLLDQNTEQLKARIASVQSEFEQLAEIRNAFEQSIRQTRDREAQAIADSFKTYILNLESSFAEDFVASQPDLDFLNFLDKNNRAMFYTSFKRAFERYMNDRLAAWEFIAKQQIGKAFAELNTSAQAYRVAYEQVVEVMNGKLLGDRFYAAGHRYDPKNVEIWTDTLQEVFEEIPDSLNGVVGQFNDFWQQIMQSTIAYIVVVVAVQIIGLIFSGMALNIFAVLLAGTGLVAGQAEFVRQEFLSATRQEFAKYLPQIAQDQWQPIYQSVQKCFDIYEAEVIDRVNDDIDRRQTELTNLLEQKETHTIQSAEEKQRLEEFEQALVAELQKLEQLAAA
ncbi:MAG: dynamin [Acaryochloridaceae cyanobacterium SU_2_1]|nr:dynamin [Acaryochloridaceae cyanobacterium SU_2_1]